MSSAPPSIVTYLTWPSSANDAADHMPLINPLLKLPSEELGSPDERSTQMTGNCHQERGSEQGHAVHEHGPARRHVPMQRQQRCAKRAHRPGHAHPPMPLEGGSGVDRGGPREH